MKCTIYLFYRVTSPNTEGGKQPSISLNLSCSLDTLVDVKATIVLCPTGQSSQLASGRCVSILVILSNKVKDCECCHFLTLRCQTFSEVWMQFHLPLLGTCLHWCRRIVEGVHMCLCTGLATLVWTLIFAGLILRWRIRCGLSMNRRWAHLGWWVWRVYLSKVGRRTGK